ncbi:MAG: hypothetical protein PVJ67_06705 [Candidatus Pacearchaeota archaeon]|jgi:hypothetical protein
MGFIRGGLFVILSVLFFVSLLVANSLYTISSSLEYENLKGELVPVVKSTIEDQINLEEAINAALPLIELYCENNSDYVFNEGGVTFAISCETVKSNPDLIVEDAIDNFVEETYYKDYNCKFLDCFKENDGMPFFLISENTKNYFQNKFYFMLPVLLVLLVGMFFLIEGKTNLPIVVGAEFIIASLPFLKMESFIGLFADKTILQFFSFLFTQSYHIFIISFILGIIILASGIVMKFFVVGFSIHNFFEKFKKKDGVVKKEVKTDIKKEIKTK